ncbi:hypothetical protein BH23CHL4_BH23CHL4_19600 [soil metagenome]
MSGQRKVFGRAEEDFPIAGDDSRPRRRDTRRRRGSVTNGVVDTFSVRRGPAAGAVESNDNVQRCRGARTGCRLYHFAGVHHRHMIGNVAVHDEVVTPEQVRQVTTSPEVIQGANDCRAALIGGLFDGRQRRSIPGRGS